MVATQRLCRRPRGVATRLLPCGGLIAALTLFAMVPVSTVDTRAQTAGDSLYAVLWCGWSDYYVYVNDLEFAFKTLVDDYGYTKENILVLLKWGGYYDLDGDGLGDVDFSATKANADTVFARLGRVMTHGDMLFFYATDHGYWDSAGSGDCNDAGVRGVGPSSDGNWLSEEQLAGYFGGLDTETRRITKVLVFNTCYAGGMIPELGNLQAPLVIATASKACETSKYDDDDCDYAPTSCHHNGYSFWWFTAAHGSTPSGTAYDADTNNDGYVTIEEASKFAKSNDEFAQEDAARKEHPLYFDENCISGKITTLGGKIPNLPKMIGFPSPCRGPLPCRWGAWRCENGVRVPFGSPKAGSVGDECVGEGSIWLERGSSASDTTWVYAKVYNGGDVPITSSVVSFYYADPTLSLVFPESGLNDIATETVPFIAPHDTVVVGPLPFVPPPVNTFGEPYWTVMAIAENYDSPVETGWLVDDDRVAASNRFELRAYPSEPKTLHVSAQNPLDVPVKALLSIDEADWPSGWTVVLTPAPGDTVEIDPDSSVPVELTLTGISGRIAEGSVDITISLHTITTKECESCEDLTCGGYIGDAGGCSVKLVLEGTVPVFAPELTTIADTRAITLSWWAPPGSDRFNVYRSEKESDDWTRLNDEPLIGSGDLTYVDEDVVPGKTYLYTVGVVTDDGEVRSAPVEAVLGQPLALELRQNYPNPFNPTTTITFSLPEKSRVTLAVYDVEGRLVRNIFEGVLDPGVKGYSWDGTDSRGRGVTAGVYFCRLSVADRVLSEKMILLK